MKPKVNILGGNASHPSQTPIKIKYLLNVSNEMVDGSYLRVKNFEFVTLLCLKYNEAGDLFMLHDSENPSLDRERTVLCIGDWNDGIVG